LARHVLGGNVIGQRLMLSTPIFLVMIKPSRRSTDVGAALSTGLLAKLKATELVVQALAETARALVVCGEAAVRRVVGSGTGDDEAADGGGSWWQAQATVTAGPMHGTTAAWSQTAIR
jgi:hypothetical protein